MQKLLEKVEISQQHSTPSLEQSLYLPVHDLQDSRSDILVTIITQQWGMPTHISKFGKTAMLVLNLFSSR